MNQFMKMNDAQQLERIWGKVAKGLGCWEWQGSLSGERYGAAYYKHQRWDAHRLIWTLENGPIPDGLCVLHRCDNVLCVRPDHLFLGTRGDNNRDAISKGRHRSNVLSAQTACKNGHPLEGTNLYVRSNGSRRCRICHNNRERNREAEC